MSDVSQNLFFKIFHNILEMEQKFYNSWCVICEKKSMHYMSSLFTLARYVKKSGFILQHYWK